MGDCILPFMVRLLLIIALSGLSIAQQHVTLKTQDGGGCKPTCMEMESVALYLRTEDC